ncbi:NUDIX hydrolase [Parafrankia sp. EAN1pec]|uniref:NUDIX hydrolase n=1 Tax=Parafrankia sp. (strain EAN1pec) TaxID=298653 RepID=UPI0000540B01|nr:NUDIX hydrolase [Frankia sp. EAN1pec]
MHSVSVTAVTRRDDGRVLCIQRRDTGAWQIPGGVLERGETFEDGLRREVREETGALVISSQTDESVAVDWLTVDEVVRRSVPAFAVRVTDALAGQPEPFLRHHDGVRVLDVAGSPGVAVDSVSAPDA